MARRSPKTIRFRGRNEPVLETFRVRGRTYVALEQMSARGAFRVYDPHAGPNGDYRALYRFSAAEISQQRVEVLRRLSGPNANRNFPPIIECVRSGDDYFVVLGWVWGTSLRDYFRAIRGRKTPRPSTTEVVRLMRGVVHGVGHFHRRLNMIHGDISPANIVLTSGTRQLVLVDFGSAWPIESAATKDFGDGVTRPYAAPERLSHHAAEDFRADAFSLAVVAYEMLTMEIPFDGLGGQAGVPHLASGLSSTFCPPSQKICHPDRLPRDSRQQLDACLRTALAFHPDDRFGSRADWLFAWDSLHDSLKKGERLTPWERRAVRLFEFFGRCFSRRKT